MSDTNLKTRKVKSLFPILIALLLVCGLFFCAATMYLPTPHAASRVSRLLSSSLHQQVLVSHLELAGTTLRLEKISIANPAGFAGHLAAADAVVIQPQWSGFLFGRRFFQLIEIDGLKLDIRKNSKGVWNFSELQRSLRSGKPSGTELFIRQLIVKNGKVQINAQAVQNINLQLHNISTKGTGDADIQLAFDDPAKNRYTIAGRARGGSESALDLTLSAPVFSINGAAGMLGVKKPLLYAEEPGALRATAVMQGKLTRVSLLYQFKGMRVIAGSAPLGGVLNAGAVYDSGKDEARLEATTLSVNDLIKLHVSGRATALRGERKFIAELSADEIDLARVAGLLPQAGQTIVMGGKVGRTAVKISGNASRGITSASGSLSFANGLLKRGSTTFVSEVWGTIGLAAAGKDIHLSGNLHSGGEAATSLLQDLDASFSAALSSKMKPLVAEVSSLSGRAMGIPFKGEITFSKDAVDPFQVALNIPQSPVQSLRPFLEHYKVQPASGTASLSLQVAGRGLADLHGTGRVKLVSIQGQQQNKSFALKRGGTDFNVMLAGGRLTLTGDAHFWGAAYAGKGGDASFAFNLVDDRLTLAKSTFKAEGISGSLERMTAQIPRTATGQPARYPLMLELVGGRFQRGLAGLNGVSGTLDANFITDVGEKWLEGNASLGITEGTWQGKPLAAPAVRVTFARAGARGEIGGTLLGGALAGNVAFNPFAMATASTFQVSITQAQLAAASVITPAAWKAVPAGGLADLTAKGTYSQGTGLDARLGVRAKALSLRDKAGKTLLSDGGISLNGGMSGQKITVDSAVVSAGEAAVTLRGAMEQAASRQRAGHFSFVLPVTQISGMIDPVVNLMPRLIQEATVAGTVAGEGTFDLQQERMLMQGALRLKGVGIDAQGVHLADLSGEIPVSLDFSGKNLGRSFDTLSFTRENYPRLLTQLRGKSSSASSVTIGSLVVGPQNLGSVTLQMSAGNGVTRVDVLRASLYGGNVYGKASFSIDRGFSSRLDLLLDSLSLRDLCIAFPKIKGYISGLLDGVISIDASGKKLTDLSGFTELWARQDKREKMLISKEFLQKLSGKKLSGFFFRNDRAYDNAEINAILEHGYLTFDRLDIKNTNIFGVKDLSVSIAPSQNRIALDHLLDTIQQAAERGTRATGGAPAGEQEAAPSTPGFQWQE